MSKIVTAVSGGKTSGYILKNYESDLNIFSIVCVDDPACASKDKMLMQYANDKIEKYCASYGEIIGTAEDPIIFKTMYQLEQYTGKEIIWTRYLSFDQLINKKNSLPIKQRRWCTTFLKIHPFFEFWLKYGEGKKWGVNVGYRYDEKERVDQFTTTYKYAYSCNNYKKKRMNWKEVEWRYGVFPLVEDKIFSGDTKKFWIGKGVEFAKDSNCQHCPFKQKHQVKMNHVNNPDQIEWAKRKEEERNYRWHNGFWINDAINSEIDTDMMYGDTDAGCKAGECLS
jgi:hypothetical protein